VRRKREKKSRIKHAKSCKEKGRDNHTTEERKKEDEILKKKPGSLSQPLHGGEGEKRRLRSVLGGKK